MAIHSHADRAGAPMMHGDLMSEVLGQLAAQAAAFLALLLGASAAHKWMRWRDSMRAVHEFAGVPRRGASAALIVVGLAEIAAAVLLEGANRAAGAGLAAVIFGIYLALMLRALASGRRNVDCGCSFGAGRHRLGPFEVSRNALLVLLALLVAGEAGGVHTPLLSRWLAAAALLALYGALDQVMSLQPMRRAEVA